MNMEELATLLALRDLQKSAFMLSQLHDEGDEMHVSFVFKDGDIQSYEVEFLQRGVHLTGFGG